MHVTEIKMGLRHRQDMGDIAGLAADIELNGLLQPIVVTPDGMLIAGARRIAAWQMTKFQDDPIPTHVVCLDAITRGEAAENFQRKAFTPSEMVAIWRTLDDRNGLAAAASARQRAGKADPSAGRVSEAVAKYFGVSGRTLEKARAVVNAAERNPAKFGRCVQEMDRTGKIDRAHKALTRQIATPRSAGRNFIADEIPIENVELCGQRLGTITIGRARALRREAMLLDMIFKLVDAPHLSGGDRLLDLIDGGTIRNIFAEYG